MLKHDAPRSTRSDRLQVRVDESRCIGIGSCEVLAAKHFRLNEYRVAEVVDAEDADQAEIMEAAMECPVEAIFVATADGEELWPPYE